MTLFGNNPQFFQMARSILLGLGSKLTRGQRRRGLSEKVLRSTDWIPVNDTLRSYSIQMANRSSPSDSGFQITKAPNCAWPMTDTRVLTCKRRREEPLGVSATEMTDVCQASTLFENWLGKSMSEIAIFRQFDPELRPRSSLWRKCDRRLGGLACLKLSVAALRNLSPTISRGSSDWTSASCVLHSVYFGK